jgi:two-component system sensor kinase FixL
MHWKIAVSYLVGYVFLDWVSYVHPVLPLSITPWNPPPALSLFLLLCFGLRNWPLLFVAALAADVLVRGVPGTWAVHVEAAALLTAVYGGAAFVLRKRLPGGARIETAHDLWNFFLVAVPATFVVACSYVGLFATVGRVTFDELVPNIAKHWVGDLNGILVFTPMLMAVHALRQAPLRWPGPRVVLEAGAQTASIVLSLWVVFGLPQIDEFKFFYLLFLPLIWISVRWGLLGATLALVGVQLGLIVAIQLGGYHSATFVQLQFLMLALAITGLMLGTVVSQRERMEQALMNKQTSLNRALQFAAAGEMTSALAHELNQPVTALSNYLRAAQSILTRSDRDERLLDETLNKAASEAQRAARVVQQLREFFRRGATNMAEVDIAALVAEVIETVRSRATTAEVQLEVVLPPGLPPLPADRTQLAMVLHNLLVNAIEAIVASAPKRRLVRVELIDQLDAVKVVVDDTGPGIAPDIEATMFEPFATSKPEGMGLGLAISRTMVRAHGGDLAAERLPGGGARFVLSLPRGAAQR